MSAQEIRRLSPCATFYRSLIGVRWDPEEGFWIWGMLIVVRTEDVTKIVDPIGSIRPKYWIKETRASQRSRELLFAVIRTLSQLGAEHGLKTVGWKDYQELENERLARLDESIFECANFLADLMAIDGALVVTAAWDVIGFGAEIQGTSSRNEVVYRAFDLEGMQLVEERADQAGTRHRAAYRLSRQHPECIIIVVSQDGSVRYVGNLNGKVTYWELGPFKRRAH